MLKPLNNEIELISLIDVREHTNTEKIYMKSMDLALGKISYEEFEAELMEINNN